MLVKLNGKQVADVKGVKRIKKGVKLTSLPTSGTYKVSVVATTILKQRLTGEQHLQELHQRLGEDQAPRQGQEKAPRLM